MSAYRSTVKQWLVAGAISAGLIAITVLAIALGTDWLTS